MQRVRPALLKGFEQEFLPGEQLQFNALVELIRRNFERYGFLPIETPSAERIEVLTSKGGAEKEIYALSRLAADRIILSCKVSAVQDLIAVYRSLAARCDYALHLGLTEAGMGSKGIVASTAAMAVLLQ